MQFGLFVKVKSRSIFDFCCFKVIKFDYQVERKVLNKQKTILEHETY
jgi:hypothetical protein